MSNNSHHSASHAEFLSQSLSSASTQPSSGQAEMYTSLDLWRQDPHLLRNKLNEMTVVKLKDWCSSLHLIRTGSKHQLIESICAKILTQSVPSTPTSFSTISSTLQQRRIRIDRDEDFDFEEFQDDGEEEDGGEHEEYEQTEQTHLIARNRSLVARKILSLGKPARFRAELHLHWMKCEFFQQIVGIARKQLQDVHGSDGTEFVLADPESHPHTLQVENVGIQNYAAASCKDFFVFGPLFLITIYFFHDPRPDPHAALLTFKHVGFFASKFVDMPKRLHTRGREVQGGASVAMKTKLSMVLNRLHKIERNVFGDYLKDKGFAEKELFFQDNKTPASNANHQWEMVWSMRRKSIQAQKKMNQMPNASALRDGSRLNVDELFGAVHKLVQTFSEASVRSAALLAVSFMSCSRAHDLCGLCLKDIVRIAFKSGLESNDLRPSFPNGEER
jgi:hypothetical protein